jgi:heme oxygenase
MGQRTTIMDCLRNETRIEHRRVELLPFAAALATSSLSLASYVAFLQALNTIHSSLEWAFKRVDHPVLRAIWDDSLVLSPRLERDLAYFAPQKLPKSPVVSIRAQIMAQRIRQRANDDPLSLLGYLYVLTGATLGSTILRTQVAQTFGLEGSDGLMYVNTHDGTQDSPWFGFRQRMNAISFDVTEQRHILDAANEAFALIAQIIEVLHPFEDADPRMLARTLNWEAGRHIVPLDEREIDAALRAGEWTWRRFPYYKWRYGARGERFTRSDSAWLVTLVECEQETINKQISWLGRVLSARGMPQWLLEYHLRHLQEALVSVVPERTALYERLACSAEMLCMVRRKYVSDELLAQCGSTFEGLVGTEWSQKIPEAGQLLAAAVADEKLGIAQAVSSIEGWMTDGSRFPKNWVDAVRTTIQNARSRAT